MRSKKTLPSNHVALGQVIHGDFFSLLRKQGWLPLVSTSSSRCDLNTFLCNNLNSEYLKGAQSRYSEFFGPDTKLVEGNLKMLVYLHSKTPKR